jgi:hypothetical protein
MAWSVLVSGTSQEAELHDESQQGCEDEGEGCPGSGGAEALCQEFNEKDKDVEAKHEKQAVGDEDSGSGGGRSEDVLDVERRKDGTDAEDKEEQKKLKEGGYSFFHGWTLEMSLARQPYLGELFKGTSYALSSEQRGRYWGEIQLPGHAPDDL